jgi:hypothetical protein
MKKLIIALAFVVTALTTNAQIMVYKLNNNADADYFKWRRGQWVVNPIWDGNGDLFLTQGVKNISLFADMACRFDLLTTPTPWVPLSEFVLRFENTIDRDNFMTAHPEINFYLNNKGDIIVNWQIEEWQEENPIEYAAIIDTQADVVDIIAEMQGEGKLNPLYFPNPTEQTPTNTWCTND